MACELCQPHEKPCRHEKEQAVPSISWQQTDPETHALVADMQDVLSVAKQRGICQKHLRAAFTRGYEAGIQRSRLAKTFEDFVEAQEQADGQP